MSFEDLLAWIRSGRAFRSSPEDLLRLVDVAFEGLTEEDPLYQPLADIEGSLLAGKVPVAELQRLASDQAAAEQD
ncbi:MAG TPA: hypothetical protein PKD55_15635 [Bellilinea sp.]|nr:hypothetical protein [Bellilinea sp.]